MAWSKLDIVNLAFNLLNKRTVESFEDSGEFANSAEAAFDVLYPTEIAGFPWRFASKIQQLSQDALRTPEIDRWDYVMVMPADYLSAITMHPRIDFQIYQGNVFYTNVNTDLFLEYRFMPDITSLPAYFVNYFSIVLAQRFANSVAALAGMAKELREEAMDARGQALFVDAQSHPTHAIISKPLLEARVNGIYLNDRYAGNY